MVLKVEPNPTFGIIYDILVFDVDQCLLVCEELITVHLTLIFMHFMSAILIDNRFLFVHHLI